MTHPIQIIPTVGLNQHASRREVDRSDADHFSLIRGVLRRQANQARASHLYGQASYAAVEEIEAALASLRHLESGRQSSN